MKPGTYIRPSRIKVSTVKEGQSIEQVIRKALQSNEPIVGNATLMYTDEKDGIRPEYDIRTDRWEMALEASDRVHASNYAQRMKSMGFEQDEKGMWKPSIQLIEQTKQNEQS